MMRLLPLRTRRQSVRLSQNTVLELARVSSQQRELRGLVDQAFQRRTVDVLKPMVTGIADRLLDKLEGRTEVDLMSEFCRDLPLSVICAMLGLPEEDHDRRN